MTLEASSESEAENSARNKGILVESISRDAEPVTLDYALPQDKKSRLFAKAFGRAANGIFGKSSAESGRIAFRVKLIRRTKRLRRDAFTLGLVAAILLIVGAVMLGLGIVGVLGNSPVIGWEQSVGGLSILIISACLNAGDDALRSLADLVDWTMNQDE